MADSYFSGLGVTAGTAVSTANINTSGNSDAADHPGHNVVWNAVGGPTATYQRQTDPVGPGLSLTAGDAQLARLDVSHTASRGSAAQIVYTPSGTPTGADSSILVCRSASGFMAYCFHETGNVLEFRNSASAQVGGVQSPTLPAGHTFQIDMVVDLNHTTPSTTNGRIIGRVINLTSNTWNTTGKFFVDTGYTVNVGTAQPTIWRVGKSSQTTTVHPQAYYASIRWGERPNVDTSTVQATAEAQFIVPSVSPPSVDLSASGAKYYISAVGTAQVGGALSYSITQTSGSVATPTLVAAGKWVVDQASSGARVYTVTVSEAGGGSTDNVVTVPAATTVASGQFVRSRLVSGALV